jgi:hypothetical protein
MPAIEFRPAGARRDYPSGKVIIDFDEYGIWMGNRG